MIFQKGPPQFNNRNTLKLPKTKFKCSVKLPCYKSKCQTCWRSVRKTHWINLLERQQYSCELDAFTTISITRFNGTATEALLLLNRISPAITKKIGKTEKYVLIKSITWSLNKKGHYTPHFHIITNLRISEDRLRKIIKRKLQDTGYGYSFKAIAIDKEKGGVRGLIGYLIDQNIVPTLKTLAKVTINFEIKRIRLVNSSHILKTKQPLREDNSLLWGLVHGF